MESPEVPLLQIGAKLPRLYLILEQQASTKMHEKLIPLKDQHCRFYLPFGGLVSRK